MTHVAVVIACALVAVSGVCAVVALTMSIRALRRAIKANREAWRAWIERSQKRD